MLPTRPRLAVRSTNSSCTTPFSTTATRVSIGVTLISISSLMNASSLVRSSTLPDRNAGLPQQLRGFKQWQAHHAGVAACNRLDEHSAEALDAVGAGLVGGLAGVPVGAGFRCIDWAEGDGGAGTGDLSPGRIRNSHASQHFVGAAGHFQQHADRIVTARGFGQYAAIQHPALI